ncbi:ASCH domain-containing protein [Bacillus marasmi]|uniref:ASCH domain-containing protein n=1 Tax=Bacillus marasmi TaxID=1926279 RepID=UPI0011C8A1AB|nr:ASCH domain-containing protein [Bacillus marasmi]
MTQHKNLEDLPPKTCTIDRLVTKSEDIQKVIQGKKTATRRNGRYADVGEVMEINGEKFVIVRVYSQTLGDLSDEHAQQEGFNTIEEYKESILSYHPGMPWLPKMRVWVHEYKAFNE